MRNCVKIFLLGDICPTNDTRRAFDEGDVDKLFGNVASQLQGSDLAVANLECVLSANGTPIPKVGPVLVGKPSYAKVLAAAGLHALGVANNHIGDCGDAGVLETLAACGDAGLVTFGAGATKKVAAEGQIFVLRGLKVGLLAFAEREFNAASETSPGAKIFDPLEDLERVRLLKDNCDYLIVLFHGGIEYFPYQSPLLQKTCRALVRAGANFVVCQHSHCIGTSEKYGGGDILYGQGNAIYGYREGRQEWNEGLAVSIELSRVGREIKSAVEYVPIGCTPSGAVDLLHGKRRDLCMRDFISRSSRAQDEAFLHAAWEGFCHRLGHTHLPHIMGYGRIKTRLNKILRGAIVRLTTSRRRRMVMMNVARCDSHREVIVSALDLAISAPNREA